MDFDSYLTHLTANNWSPQSIKAYHSDLRFFAAFLKRSNLRLNQVTRQVIGDFVSQMRTMPNPRFGKEGLSEKTILRRLAALSGFFNYLRITSNPHLNNPVALFLRSRRRGVSNTDDCRAVSETTIEQILAGVDNLRDRAVILLFISSGLRLSELVQLDISSIHEVTEQGPSDTILRWGAGRVVGKGRKERSFYFDEPTIEAIKIYLGTRCDTHPALFLSERRQRLSGRAIQDMLAHWCAKLGLEHIHPHQLRHSFATRLANANIEAMVLKDLMGHSHFETTTRYFKLSEQTCAREYFAAMEFFRGRPSSDT